jgi:hypothetical protein
MGLSSQGGIALFRFAIKKSPAGEHASLVNGSGKIGYAEISTVDFRITDNMPMAEPAALLPVLDWGSVRIHSSRSTRSSSAKCSYAAWQIA